MKIAEAIPAFLPSERVSSGGAGKLSVWGMLLGDIMLNGIKLAVKANACPLLNVDTRNRCGKGKFYRQTHDMSPMSVISLNAPFGLMRNLLSM